VRSVSFSAMESVVPQSFEMRVRVAIIE
jgi:hypothetical protein